MVDVSEVYEKMRPLNFFCDVYESQKSHEGLQLKNIGLLALESCIEESMSFIGKNTYFL